MKHFLTEIPIVKRRVIVYNHVTEVLISLPRLMVMGHFCLLYTSDAADE